MLSKIQNFVYQLFVVVFDFYRFESIDNLIRQKIVRIVAKKIDIKNKMNFYKKK